MSALPDPATSFLCEITVGRERETAAMRDRLTRARPGVVLISGDAGIGKSRLLADTRALAEACGYPFALGRCDETETTVPYAAVTDLLRTLHRTAGDAPFVALPPSQRAMLAKLLPGLRDRRPDADGAGDTEPLDRHVLADALLAALRHPAGMAAAPMTVVAIEDLHWADAATLELLLLLARRAAEASAPALFALTYRGDEVHDGLGHLLAKLDRGRLADEVSLRPLATAEVDAMVRAILKSGRPAPADLLHLLASLTEGNPFFIEEVLKSLSAAGQLDRAENGWRLRRGEEPRIPRSVQDTVRRRAARLSPGANRVLRIAAVAGERFDFDLPRAIAGVPDDALTAAIRELVGAQLVTEAAADRFAFRHALTRQAVVAELLLRERKQLHREIAGALAARDDVQPADLAYHAFHAELWPEALAAARAAGDLAMAMHAPRAAIAEYTRAMVAAARMGTPLEPRLLRARGAAHETLGAFDEALADLEAARAAATTVGDAAEEAEALLALGFLWTGRDYEAAGGFLQAALTVARGIQDDALLSRALNRVGNWLLNRQQQPEAIALHEEALAIVERLGQERDLAATLDLLGLAYSLGGDVLRGAASLDRAVRIWRAIDDRRGLVGSLTLTLVTAPNFHTAAVPAVRRSSELAPVADEAIRLAREIGWRAGECWALWVSGGLWAGSHGAYGRALGATREALALAEEIDHVQWQAAGLCMLGNIERELFALPRARASLRRAVTFASEARSPYWEWSAAAWLALVEIAAGDLAAADATLQPALAVAGTLETIAGRLLWLAQAELLLARGDAAGALAICDHLIATMPNARAHGPAPMVSHPRGRALLALNQLAEAEAELRGGLARARERDARPSAWRLSVELARCLERMDRTGEAAELWASGWAIVRELAETMPDADPRDGFLAGAEALFPRRGAAARARSNGRDELTERERAVAALLTRGLSNREIAAELYITDWTAATHVRNILAKLGFASRAQIAAWAAEQGLTPPAPGNT